MELQQKGTKQGLVVPAQQGSRFTILHKFKITDTFSQTIKTPNLQPFNRHDITGPIYIQLAMVYEIHISSYTELLSGVSSSLFV